MDIFEGKKKRYCKRLSKFGRNIVLRIKPRAAMFVVRFANLTWRLKRVFRCCSVCETMEDYKEGYLMVWANYISPCSSESKVKFN